jgi:hypothetical protein
MPEQAKVSATRRKRTAAESPSSVESLERAGITLTGEPLRRVRELGQSQGDASPTEIVKRALSMYAFIYDEIAKGSKIMLRTPDGETQLLKFLHI